MARINNREKYPQDAEVTAEDFLTGSDHRTGQTKTYKISSILALGGNPPVGDTAASLSGNTITFPDGQTVQIPTDTDTNTFATINSGVITFANGDTVNLGNIDTDTFATLSNDILTLADGATYNLADTAATLAGSVITFPTGQTITVPNSSTDDQVASEVPVQTSNFNGNLRPTDNTVQKALDRIDDLDINANNNYTIDVIGDTVNLLNNGTIISSDTLTTLASSITNTSTGNTIATHISGSGVQTDIAESITRLNINANILEYTREDGIVDTVDLSLYLDDTNLARLVSGVINVNTNIATFTRDDNSTFTIDFSNVLAGKEDVSNKQTDLLSTDSEHYPNVLSVVEASNYGVPNNSTNLGRIRFSLGSPNSNNTSISDEGDAMILPTTLSNNVLVRKSYQDSLPVEERLNILDKEAGVYILSIALLSNSGGTHRYKIDASKIQLIGDVYALPAEEVVESPNSTDINVFVIDNVSSYTVSTKLVEVVKDEDIAVLQSDVMNLENEITTLQNAQLSGFISYQTEAELLAHPNPITTEAYRVTNDTDPSKNGTYTYDGTDFVQDAFVVENEIVESNNFAPVSGKAVSDKINTFFANPSDPEARAIFDTIQDIFIVDIEDNRLYSDYSLSYIWANSTAIGNTAGRIGFQISRNETQNSNFGIPLDVEISALKKGSLLELFPQSSTEPLANELRVFIVLKNVPLVTQNYLKGLGGNYYIFKESCKQLNEIFPLIESTVANAKEVTLLDRSKVSSSNEKLWKSLVEDIYVVDINGVNSDGYKVSFVWVNASGLGKFGLQLLKNDADASNFTIALGDDINGGDFLEIKVQNSSQPLQNIHIFVKFKSFNSFPSESFSQGLGGSFDFFTSKAFSYKYNFDALRVLNNDFGNNTLYVSRVGAGYNLIQEAINDSKDGDTIFIYPGIYTEALNTVGKKITLIGASKYTTIIRTLSGDYYDPPLECAGGTVCRNLTFSAQFANISSPPPNILAYGVHMDYYGEGVTEFNNCIVESHVNSAFGVGMHLNQTLKIINCELYQYADGSNYDGGAMYFHNAPQANEPNQKLIMRNNFIRTEHNLAMRIDDARDNAGGVDINTVVEFIGNTFISDIQGISAGILNIRNESIDGGIAGKIQLSVASHGNNLVALNNF